MRHSGEALTGYLGPPSGAVARPSRPLALAESCLATVIWASSFVIVKLGLEYVPPLTVAALRFCLAAALLSPFALRHRAGLRAMPRRVWLQLFLLGLSAYAVGNGAVFWTLGYLPATTVSFVLSLSPLLVLLVSVLWLRESPTWLQAAGVVAALGGSLLFFSPGLQAGERTAMIVLVAGLVAFASFAILGRQVARDRRSDTLALTLVPIAFGGVLLLGFALVVEGVPAMSATGWAIVLWLAVINTALAYFLYNHALQTLTALELNALLNLAPLGTAGFAWLLLGEGLSLIRLAGIAVMVAGVTLVQWK